MKTIIWTLCYLNGDMDNGGANLKNARYLRNVKYLDYMESIKSHLHFDEIWFIDNNSNMDLLKSLGGNIYDTSFNKIVEATTRPYLNVVHFTEFMGRGRGRVWDIPYCWRGLYFIPNIVKFTNADKVFSIDTDCFVLSKKLASFLNTCNSGWVTFHCKKYNFPEAALFVLNKDSFPLLDKLMESPWSKFNNIVTMENVLPFTEVLKTFTGDRYGETRLPQTEDMDYYGQCPVAIPMIFNMKNE